MLHVLSPRVHSDAKRLATSARSLYVRVVEHKLGGQRRFDVVHFGSKKTELCFLIDDNPHSLLNNFFVQFVFRHRVVECVAESIAASLLNSNFQANLKFRIYKFGGADTSRINSRSLSALPAML